MRLLQVLPPLAMCCFVAANAHAQPASDADRWAYIGYSDYGGGRRTMSYDTTTLEVDGDLRRAWLRIMFLSSPGNLGGVITGETRYDTVLTQEEYDCRRRTRRTRAVRYFYLGVNTHSALSAPPTEWSVVTPHSIAEATLNVVCKGAGPPGKK